MHSTPVTSIARAKKRHGCNWCGEPIDIGEPYKRYRFYDGSDAGTAKMHPECLGACDRLVAEQGWIEFDQGEYNRGCTCERGDWCNECKPQQGKGEE